MRLRDAAVAAGFAVIAGLAPALPSFDIFDGLDIDALHWLRERIAPLHQPPESSPTVVVAIDEASFATPPFIGRPKVMWTPQIATVLRAVLDGGATVIGWDIVLTTLASTYLSDLQFDRPLLRELGKARKTGRVVLGKAQFHLSSQEIMPNRSLVLAIGGLGNVRSINLDTDPDGIVRAVPLFLSETGTDGARQTGMALELAARSVGTTPKAVGGGAVEFQDRLLPSSGRHRLRLNFDGGAGAIPIYSFADLFHCAESGKIGYFKKQFAGKVVLFGTVLDLEDRKFTSNRLITRPDHSAAPPRCTTKVREPVNDIARNSTPGVIVHATAVNNILRGDSVTRLATLPATGTAVGLALIVAFLVMRLRPARAGLAVFAVGVVWVGAATWAFRGGLALPLFDPIAGGILTFGGLLGYRFAVSDRDRNRIRRSFQFYLPRAVIDRMLEGDRMPEIGGEERELTVLFSDIQGYSAIAEPLTPRALVSFLNEYLSVMAEIIEAHGGFIDKYIGDAVVAVFGAPGNDPDHAAQGVRAALACQAALLDHQDQFGLPDGVTVATRFGLNTGTMLVGNIGSRRRFNYTVIGDAVNLAARLEGANKRYGSWILVSGETVRRCGDALRFRELDAVRVVGREQPVRIYEPLGETGAVTPERTEQAARYAAALRQYRNRDFTAAKDAFEALAGAGDRAAHWAAARAAAMRDADVPADWDGVTNLDQK